MKHYNDLPEAINGLRAHGYEVDFIRSEDCIVCPMLKKEFYPDQFSVDAFYRFEGMSSTDDNSIIYAISSNSGVKGILIDAYGVYGEALSIPMQRKLAVTPGI
jgi:hypothetical protein